VDQNKEGQEEANDDEMDTPKVAFDNDKRMLRSIKDNRQAIFVKEFSPECSTTNKQSLNKTKLLTNDRTTSL
jgi:hypothetical protein